MNVLNSQNHVRNPLNRRCINKVPIVEAEIQQNETTETKANVLETDRIYKHYEPSLRLLRIRKTVTGACGFNLTRTKWDPYPWVNAVDAHTAAEMSGLKAGDCVLEVNGEDVLGLRITDIAKLVQAKSGHVTLLLWSCGSDFKCDPESICCAPMPRTLQRLATIVQSILTIIECPVCLDTIAPPVMQCQNGHLLCLNCRIRAEKCPICRDRYTPQRALIAEQIYAAITSAYNLCSANEDKLRQKLFGQGEVGGAETTARVKSRRWRRAEAAKQTIEDDQQTEAGEERLQMKKHWKRQKQIRRRQCQSLDEVVPGVAGQTGRFGYVKDADTAVGGEKTTAVTDVTDVSATKHETKRKKILMKLWNGKATTAMENYSTSWVEQIKPIKSGQQNSRVIDTSSDGNAMHGETLPVIESQVMAGLPAHTLQYFSNRSDSNKVSVQGEEWMLNILQNHATSNEKNNSDSTRNNEDTEEEAAITTTARTITTATPMTMQTQLQMEPLTMPLNCATINEKNLNDAATNNVAHVNAMSKLLTTPATTRTTNHLPATRPPHSPLSQHHQQEAVCKNNATTAETVKHNGKIVAQRKQHVQPRPRQLSTWQQEQQQQEYLTENKKCDSVLAATSPPPPPPSTFSSASPIITCECCSQQSRQSESSSSFENCSYSSASSSYSLPLEDKRQCVVHTPTCSNKCYWPKAETTSLPPADLKNCCCSKATGRSQSERISSKINNGNSMNDSLHFFNSTTASSDSSGICCSSMDPNDSALTIQ